MAQYTAVSNPLQLEVNENISVRAIFTPAPPITPTPTPSRAIAPSPTPVPRAEATFVTAPPEGGTIRLINGQRGRLLYTGPVPLGTDIGAEAVPAAGWRFVDWRSEINGESFVEATSSTHTFKIIADAVYYARFEFIEPNPTPSPTPSPSTSRIVEPPRLSPTPSRTPTASTLPPQVSPPAPTPTPSRTPPPSPTPSPAMWRSCDGRLNMGTPTEGFVEVPYLGAGGGFCWEAQGTIGFVPSLTSLRFKYQRGSSTYPQPISVRATNPSYAISYRVKLTTDNTLFEITPSEMTIPPREDKTISIKAKSEAIATFGDGLTRFNLQVDIQPLT